jgi:hypothetical protein
LELCPPPLTENVAFVEEMMLIISANSSVLAGETMQEAFCQQLLDLRAKVSLCFRLRYAELVYQ